MRVAELQVKNFLSIGDIKVDLNRTGLNLVLGKNLDDKRFDSNGSAKSALFEAMTWGLFGEFLRDIPTDSIIRNGQSHVTVKVLVDPEDGTERVWFIRDRSKKEHTLSVITETTGQELFPANSVKDVQKQVNSWLGIDFKTFTNSVYFGKGLVKFFMASTDTERKDLLETILQLVSFDEALNSARDISKACSERISDYLSDLKVTDALLIEKGATFRSFDSDLKSLESVMGYEKPRIKQVLSDLKTEIDTNSNELSKCKSDIDSIKTVYEKNKADTNNNTKAVISAYETKLHGLISGTKKNYDNSCDNLKKMLIKDLDFVQNELKKVETKLSDLTELEKKSNKSINTLEVSLEQLFNEQEETNNMSVGVPCNSCKQIIDITHKEELLSKIKEKIVPLQNKLQHERQSLERLLKNKKAVQEDLDESNKSITTLNNDYIDRLAQYNEQKNKTIEVYQKDLAQYVMKMNSSLVLSLDALSKEYNSKIEEHLKTKNELEQRILVLKAEVEKEIKYEKELDRSYKSLSTQVEELKNDLARLHTTKTKLAKKISTEEKTKVKTDFWIEGFGPRGVKSFVFENALPYLTERANHYSSFITGGTVTIDISPITMVKSTGNTKEKLSVSATNRHGANIYPGNSDGERRRIDICILLALQDLITTRATKTWNTLIFDEIFDALDRTGIEHVIDLFRTFKNKDIFIVSHSEDIKKYFDTAIVLQKQNGVSSLKDA